MKKFKPRISFRETWIIYALFLVFWCIGIIFLSGYMDSRDASGEIIKSYYISGLSQEQFIGLVFFLFGSFAMGISLIKNLALGCWYAVEADSIVVSINGFKNRLKFSDLSGVKKINEQQVEQLAASMRQKQLGINLAKIPSAVVKSIDYLRYNTVPIVFEEVSVKIGKRRSALRIFSKVVNVSTGGDFVLVVKKNGRSFLLSPRNVDDFMQALPNYLTNIQV